MKNKGSALVFTVLILAFFLAISLNIFFLAEKKGKQAIVRVNGEKVTNSIDIASSIGYQDLYMASLFVKKGFLYDATHPAVASSLIFDNRDYETSGGGTYIDPITGLYVKKYAGIHLESISEYFTNTWIYENVSPLLQKFVLYEPVINSSKRTWQDIGAPRKSVPLWAFRGSLIGSDENKVSIGGYRLTNITVANNSNPSQNLEVSSTSDILNFVLSLTSGTDQNFKATYTKFVRLEDDSNLNLEELNFKLEYSEEFVIKNNNLISIISSIVGVVSISDLLDLIEIDNISNQEFVVTLLD